MLERAIISGVEADVDETVYRLRGVEPAPLFSVLAAEGVNVDTILQAGTEIVFSAPTDDDATTSRILGTVADEWSSDAGLGKVSVVGAGMRSHPRVVATAFATLRDARIEPVIVTTSPIKIAVHVPRADVDQAVAALRRTFELDD